MRTDWARGDGTNERDDEVRHQPERAAPRGPALPHRPRPLSRRHRPGGRARLRVLPQPGRPRHHHVPRRGCCAGGSGRAPRSDRRGPRGPCREQGRLRHGAERRRHVRREAAPADPRRGPGALCRRDHRRDHRRQHHCRARRARPDRMRLRRIADPCGDRARGRDHPPGGARQCRLRLGTWRRRRRRCRLRGRRPYDTARTDRQPGDLECHGAARLHRPLGRRAAACRLFRSGRVGVARRTCQTPEARPQGGACHDAGCRRRLRHQGLQLSGIFRRRRGRAQARPARPVEEHARRGDAVGCRRARPCDRRRGRLRFRLPAAGAADRLRLEPRRLQRAERPVHRLGSRAQGDARRL